MLAGNRLRFERLRIVLAITAKDLIEAIKNKNTLAVILPVLFIVIFYRILPGFAHREDPPTVIVADPGESAFGMALQDSPFLNVYLSPSEERMKLGVSEADKPELGLVLPEDVDARITAGSSLILQGYTVQWLAEPQVDELERAVEEELASLVGQSVEVEIDSTSIYPQPDSHGLSRLMGLSLTFSAVMLGVSFLPHLILEEKVSRTIEALQVAPVRPIELALGKALVGMVYSMVIGIVGIALYGPLITHWGIAVLVYMAGALFMTALGLILGSMLDNRQQLMLWAWVILIPLLIPTFLVIMEGLVPDAAIAIMRWLPSVALTRGLTVAAVESAALSDYLVELLILLLGSFLLLGWVVWLLRRMDR